MIRQKALTLAAAATLLLLAHGPVAADYYSDEVEKRILAEAEARKRERSLAEGKFRENRKAASLGDKVAQYEMGVAYASSSSHPVEQNHQLAFEWFLKSAQQGYGPAQDRVGDYYYQGQHAVGPDQQKARYWYEHAAAQGIDSAMYMLAGMYEEGNGGPKNPVKARDLYIKLAREHKVYDDRAARGLVRLYKEHFPDDPDVVRWLEIAHEAGWDSSTLDLIEIYSEGRLVRKNDAKVFSYLQQLTKRNPNLLQQKFMLATMYEEGRGVRRDKKKADAMFSELFEFKYPPAILRAAEKGDAQAQYDVAQTYIGRSAVEENHELAFEWFLKSAQQGYGPAQALVGDYYFHGNDVVERDRLQAIYWYEKAVDHSIMSAIYQLGQIYSELDDDGVPVDLPRALHMFRRILAGTPKHGKYYIDAAVAKVDLYKEYDPDSWRRRHWMEEVHKYGSSHDAWARITRDLIAGATDNAKRYSYLTTLSRRTRLFPEEKFMLATMYENGHGVSRDLEKAEKLFSELAKVKYPPAVLREAIEKHWDAAWHNNDAQAQYEIAQAYIDKGDLSDEERESTIEWLEMAAKQKHKEARVILSVIYTNPISGHYYDKDKGLAIMEEVASEGDTEVQMLLVDLLRGEDDAKALYWLQMAADQGSAKAQYYLGMAYLEGQMGAPKDAEKAVELFYSASKFITNAAYEMGRAFEYGHGMIEVDLEGAMEWYESAANAGFGPAIDRLAELKGTQ